MQVQARQSTEEEFSKRFPSPVFVSQYVAIGDLKKSTVTRPPGGTRGRTMHHIKDTTDLKFQPVLNERWIAIARNSDGVAHPWLTVGRDRTSDIMINDYTVSATHARLHFLPLVSRILLADAQSTNATAHNGAVLHDDEQRMLVDKDSVRFGRMVFAFFRAKTFYQYLVQRPSPV
jgi:hypothetical protein